MSSWRLHLITCLFFISQLCKIMIQFMSIHLNICNFVLSKLYNAYWTYIAHYIYINLHKFIHVTIIHRCHSDFICPVCRRSHWQRSGESDEAVARLQRWNGKIDDIVANPALIVNEYFYSSSSGRFFYRWQQHTHVKACGSV